MMTFSSPSSVSLCFITYFNGRLAVCLQASTISAWVMKRDSKLTMITENDSGTNQRCFSSAYVSKFSSSACSQLRDTRYLNAMTNDVSEYSLDSSNLTEFSHFQEEELRKSGEAKYAHLSNDLHVLIEVFAPPGEAYSRMSHALEEIKKFLVPVSSFRHFFIYSSSCRVIASWTWAWFCSTSLNKVSNSSSATTFYMLIK